MSLPSRKRVQHERGCLLRWLISSADFAEPPSIKYKLPHDGWYWITKVIRPGQARLIVFDYPTDHRAQGSFYFQYPFVSSLITIRRSAPQTTIHPASSMPSIMVHDFFQSLRIQRSNLHTSDSVTFDVRLYNDK